MRLNTREGLYCDETSWEFDKKWLLIMSYVGESGDYWGDAAFVGVYECNYSFN